MPQTPQQEVWLIKHKIWDWFDEGLDRDEILDELVEYGVKGPAAGVLIKGCLNDRKHAAHDQSERNRIVGAVEAAARAGDPDEIVDAMEPACDDDRTLYQVYCALSRLLFGPPPACKWGAFGLSKMHGFGDYSLVKALEHEQGVNRFYAAFGLGTMGAEAEHALLDLRQSADDPDERVRGAVRKAIQRIEADL